MPIPLEKIIEAAQKAGFATELKVASVLADAKWTPRQNVYFIDKDEMKGREFDIRAHRVFSSTLEKPQVTCMITLCIEIKRTANPFIFYTNERGEYDGSSGYGLFHWRNNVDRFVLSYQEIEQTRPMAVTERIARSYSSLEGQTQQIQSGVISAFKAAVHERDRCNEIYSDLSGDICFFIPVLVVDGPLYECFFEQGGNNLVARQIDEVVYVQNYDSLSYGRLSNNVFVMNPSSLSRRLPQFSAWGEHMLAAMAEKRAQVATCGERDKE